MSTALWLERHVLIKVSQGGRCVYGRLLPHVYLDTIHMGHHKRTGTDIIVFCNTRWTVAPDEHAETCFNFALRHKHVSCYSRP